MADSFWTVKSGHQDGDILYNLKKNVDSSYVEFELEAFNDRRNLFDISFYYRSDSRYSWMEDAVIVETDASYLDGNKIYGLKCSKTGEKNKIVWKYSSNNLVHYSVPQIKIKILPRVIVYSQAVSKYSIADVYGRSFVDFRQISDDNLIGVNIDGEYFGIKDDEFYVLDSWSYSGVLFPKHAIQLNNGNYVVADYGNNRVIELDETLTDVLRDYSITSPVFVDYCSSLEVLLVTSESGFVREIGWADYSFSSSSSSCSLSSLGSSSSSVLDNYICASGFDLNPGVNGEYTRVADMNGYPSYAKGSILWSHQRFYWYSSSGSYLVASRSHPSVPYVVLYTKDPAGNTVDGTYRKFGTGNYAVVVFGKCESSSSSSDNILWESSCLLNNPSCATYKTDDCGIVNICDYGNNRVINCVKQDDEYAYFNGYDLGNGVGDVAFRYPYRVCQGENGNIVVVEKRGRKIGWDVLESSSSSSSESS